MENDKTVFQLTVFNNVPEDLIIDVKSCLLSLQYIYTQAKRKPPYCNFYFTTTTDDNEELSYEIIIYSNPAKPTLIVIDGSQVKIDKKDNEIHVQHTNNNPTPSYPRILKCLNAIKERFDTHDKIMKHLDLFYNPEGYN